MGLWWCHLVVICSVFLAEVAGQLECSTGETKAASKYLYDDSGKTCDELIASTLDYSSPDLVSVCQRWMGDGHPDYVNGAFIFYCQVQSDGRLQYRVNTCCEGEEMRCFSYSNYTNDIDCVENGVVEVCGTNEVCRTTISYPYPSSLDAYGEPYKDTGCAEVTTCSSEQAQNSDTCRDWVADPKCVYCCNTTNCNHDTPEQEERYVGEDTCLSNPCYNGATCVPGDPANSGYTCNCTTDWTGELCEVFVECNPSPCQNGARCYGPVNTDTRYVCRCTLGWSGTDCDVAYPQCSSNTFCENGGTCIDHGEYGLRCRCPEGYVGSQCEIRQMTCDDESKYKIHRTGFEDFSNTSCTKRINTKQRILSVDWLLNDRCPLFLAPSGESSFINYEDGYVDRIDSRSYQVCEKGETHAYFIDVVCCPSCYFKHCQNGAWCVQDDDRDYICRCRYGWYGRNCDLKNNLCIVAGDPHYTTFDRQVVHFQGFNSYELASSLPGSEIEFKIVGTNMQEKADDKVSYLKSFTIDVCGHQVILGRNKAVQVDGVDTGADVEYDCFKILMNGIFVRLETEFNLVVEYDGMRTGVINIPSDLSGQIQGMCGNFDGDSQNDYMTRDGEDVKDETRNDFLLGKGWATTSAVDHDYELNLDCDGIKDTINSNEYCGFLEDTTGPFRSCIGDNEVTSSLDMTNCYYDVCVNKESPQDMKTAACGALEAFAVKCKAAGHVSAWREEAECPLNCPSGMIYKQSAPACHATCKKPDAPEKCHLPYTESCVCPEGQLLDHNTCITPPECKCGDGLGNLYNIGDSWLSEDCSKTRRCAVCDTCSLPVARLKGKNYRGCKSDEKCVSLSLGVGACVPDESQVTNRPPGGGGVRPPTIATQPPTLAPTAAPTTPAPTSITTINDEAVIGTSANKTVTTTVEYVIRTEITGEETPVTIQLFKKTASKTDNYICFVQRVCETTFTFAAGDADADSYPDGILGSQVNYQAAPLIESVNCEVEVDSGVGRVMAQTLLHTLWLTVMLMVIL